MEAAIWLVEDDESIRELVLYALGQSGFATRGFADGASFWEALQAETPSLALLDIMLPGADGYELLDYCKTLDVPVIFLTALGEVEDRVRGLRRGAEDYLPKPFALSELLARVETVLRRCGKGEQLLRLEPDIEIDPAARIVRKGGQAVALTAKEFDLLVLFVQNKNVVLCRDRIFERVWNEEYLGDSRTVDLHVQRMRKKLGLEDRLTAVYKVGYRLEE